MKYDFITPLFKAISGHCKSLPSTASDKNLTESHPFPHHNLLWEYTAQATDLTVAFLTLACKSKINLV